MTYLLFSALLKLPDNAPIHAPPEVAALETGPTERPSRLKPVLAPPKPSKPVKAPKRPPAPQKTVPPPAQTFEVTAYTAYEESTGKTPGHPAFGITASGRKVQAGVTVACPPDMPFGTWLEIEGVGKRRCDDRGGAIRGNRLDIYIPDKADALEFGRRRLKVRILNERTDRQ
jgi:3D (Asp-Asp-Asp) domain-containing protein